MPRPWRFVAGHGSKRPVVKRIHFLDLRTALAPVCTALPGKCTACTDATISAGQTVIKAVHLDELRANVRALE
jgi:hypothetical protein